MGYNLLINGVFLGGYNPLILSIDPNFQRDIQVVDSQGCPKMGKHQQSQAAQNGSLERVVSDMNSKKAGRRFGVFGVAETTKCWKTSKD